MQHQMIMFAGSSPGAGKSTLSHVLFQQLRAQHVPAVWLYEEAFLHLPSFAPFLHDLATSYPKIDLLLQAAATLSTTYPGRVIVTDSFVPGYHLLVGNHPAEAIQQYSIQLYQALRALDPMIIYLSADPAIAYARAVQQRGSVWLDRMIQRMNRWQLPLYANKPFRRAEDVLAFEQQIDAVSLFLLERWPGPVCVLDATAASLADLQAQMLNQLGLVELAIVHPVELDLLSRYAGSYAGCAADAWPDRLAISLRDSDLFVDTYWPNGTRLVAETDVRFRLESTDRWVEFGGGATAGHLTYWTGNRLHRYVRVGA